MFGNILCGILEVLDCLVVGQSHQAFAEAVAAVHGTVLGCNDQGRVRVLVQDSVALIMFIVTVRIPRGFTHLASHNQFINGRDRQFADRVLGVIWIDEAEIVARDVHGMIIQHLMH